MTKRRKYIEPPKTISPNPTSFSRGKSYNPTEPQALKREATTRSQVNYSEDTLIYGQDDAFPLKLAQAVSESPATTSCIGTREKFIKGAGFSNKDLMKIKINKNGQTLWDLHGYLSKSLALFEGFSVNFKYTRALKFANVYTMSFESLRFVKPKEDTDTEITKIKYNPYFGTEEFKKEFTKTYPLYTSDKAATQKQINEWRTEDGKNVFPGQVYYYGSTKPLYRFYPVPDYWSAKKWIEIDGRIQNFHAKNLGNGFFQSVLMNVIGDPSQPSMNPETQREVTVDGVTRKEPTETVGQEFSRQMSESFSGDDRAGSVMALWSLNQDTAVKIQAFPNNTNADLFAALQNLTTKNITIATRTPGILANISEGINLGSDGKEMQKAVELMQSDTVDQRVLLEQFYNEVLIPNLDVEGQEIPADSKVEIVNFNPITVPVEIDDKFWQFMNDEEKIAFIKKHTDIEIIRTPALQATAQIDPITNEPIPVEQPAQINENLKNLTGRQLQNIQRIVSKFNKGQLTFDQAKQALKSGFGFTDEEVNIWLVTADEEAA